MMFNYQATEKLQLLEVLKKTNRFIKSQCREAGGIEADPCLAVRKCLAQY